MDNWMRFDRELLKGHLKVMVLRALEDGPGHAYAMRKWIEEQTLEVFQIPEGTLYPTLHRLEKEGLVESGRVAREKKPAIRQYQLTARGRKTLEESRREWRFFSRAMDLLMNRETQSTEPAETNS